MMESLSLGGFRWMSQDELTVENVTSFTDDGEEGCFVECTLSYPNALHDVHDDYLLAPVKRKITYCDLFSTAHAMCDHHSLKHTLKKEKLLTTFEKRWSYILHYRNLKLYLHLGMQVEEM